MTLQEVIKDSKEEERKEIIEIVQDLAQKAADVIQSETLNDLRYERVSGKRQACLLIISILKDRR